MNLLFTVTAFKMDSGDEYVVRIDYYATGESAEGTGESVSDAYNEAAAKITTRPLLAVA